MPLKFEFVQEPWPIFTEAQVAFLEEMFPARCIKTNESIEDHIRYAGKVDLIAQLREHVIGSPMALLLNEDEEDALDGEVAAIVRERLNADNPQE